MTKRKTQSVFDGIMTGAKEALAFAQGEADASRYNVHIPDDLDVKAIRESTGLTQAAFARRFGFNLARLRDLEQKRTHPDSVVRAYLLVIQRNPDAVRDALAA
ncbi:MAG: hypothetical protein WDN01_10290 [Rhizomicrobium sp.]